MKTRDALEVFAEDQLLLRAKAEILERIALEWLRHTSVNGESPAERQLATAMLAARKRRLGRA